MVYVEIIEDDRALIFEGPVVYGQQDPKILTSSDINDVKDSWELKLLPDKECEWPALRKNASDALRIIERYVDKMQNERTILDFGSGWGFFLAVAKERGWTAYGLEPLPASSVYARSRFGLNIVTDTLHENSFTPDSFDVVTAFQVFEHLPQPGRDIRNIRRILRKNGIVLIEVPNFETWTMSLMKSKHRHFVQDHLNFFSVDTLSKMLIDSGFSVIHHYHPTRQMSIRHLSNHWLRRFLPAPIAGYLQDTLKKTILWEKTIGINLGDIITVIGRKNY